MKSLLCLLIIGGCSETADSITAGRAFVTQRKCAACHQSPNPKDGVLSGLATALTKTPEVVPIPADAMVYPPNLTPDVETGLGGWADVEIIRAIRYGVDNDQVPLCPTMPHFDGTSKGEAAMTDVEANAIVAYLRSLPAVSRPDIPESICPPLKTEDSGDMPDMAASQSSDDGGTVDGGAD